MNDIDATPDPGSDEAQDQGCHCPVLDNRGATPGTFVYDMGCSLHARQEKPSFSLVTNVAKRLLKSSAIVGSEIAARQVAEEALQASLDPREPDRLYTESEVRDAQASEAKLVARGRDKTICKLREENQRLRELLAASSVYEAVINSGMFVRKDEA